MKDGLLRCGENFYFFKKTGITVKVKSYFISLEMSLKGRFLENRVNKKRF